MSISKFSGGILVVIVIIQTTNAAEPSNNQLEVPGIRYQPIPTLPPDFGHHYHHASTAGEGWLRGCAALFHASGNYYLNCSQAAVLFEYAELIDAHNRRVRIDSRIQNRARLRADKENRLERKRVANREKRLATYRSAYQLAAEDFDRSTGEIHWPVALQDSCFDDVRRCLEEIFRKSVHGLAASERDNVQTAHHIMAMRTELQSRRNMLQRSNYLDGHKFLIGLQYENAFARDNQVASSP